MDWGAFCEVYGDTINNRVLEYALENRDIDFAVSDMARELKISKPTAYAVIGRFEKKGYVKKTRTVGKTQLYALDEGNRRVLLFLHDFRKCLKIVAEEGAEDFLPETKIRGRSASA